MGHQGSPAAKANSLLGCVRKSIGGRWREVTLPLCSALVRPCLQCCARVWAPQDERDTGIVGRAPQGPSPTPQGDCWGQNGMLC